MSLLNISLACALAVNVKFSGILLGIFLAASLAVRALAPWPWQVFGWEMRGRGARLLVAISACLFTAVVCWGVIWAVYRFRYSFTPDPSLHSDRATLVHVTGQEEFAAKQLASGNTDTTLPQNPHTSPFVQIMIWIDDHHLLPEAWVNGLMYTYQATLIHASYLMGKTSQIGAWYYFPCAVLFKTPLAVLLLAGIIFTRGAWQTARSAVWRRPSLGSAMRL